MGKSTIFSAPTSAPVEAGNCPSCIIDPNIGVVAVPDPRLDIGGDVYLNVKETNVEIAGSGED